MGGKGGQIALGILTGGLSVAAQEVLSPDTPDVDIPAQPNLDEQRARQKRRKAPGIAANILSRGNSLGSGASVGKRTLGGAE